MPSSTRNQEIIHRYNNGETLISIGETYNITKQRIWQIVKPTRPPRRHLTFTKINARPEEILVARRLRDLGYSVKHMPYTYPHDLLVNGSMRVEVKGRTNGYPNSRTNRRLLYYKIAYLEPKDFDFLVVVSGDSSAPMYYVIPSVYINQHIAIPVDPKNNSRTQRLFRERWDQFKIALDKP